MFERIDLNYKLAAPVINVLIHYVIGANDAQRVTKTFLDAVASNMLVKQIDTFEKAVLYVREQAQVEQDKERRKEAATSYAGGGYNGSKGGSRSGGSRGTSRKPSIPIVQEDQSASAVSADELEELLKLARKLDGK